MNTLTLNNTYAGNPLDRMDAIARTIPSFMEGSGLCSVLVRNYGDPSWDENWVYPSAYITEAEEATPLEVDAYMHGMHGLTDLLDVPEPIAIHDQDTWLDCISDDHLNVQLGYDVVAAYAY